ncbi:MAG TPA: rod shape-determining protein MreC [Longimicrobiales bacterium]|nr:rod shape-determining protein MreC [Longimicrobiales bacterium]
MLDFDGSRKTRRRDAALSGGILLLALLVLILPAAYQQPVRTALRATVLRPFIGAQAQLAQRRGRGVDVGALRAQRDSLVALVAAQAALAEENAQLRATVGLRERLQSSFRSANVLRLGTAGAESTFLIDIGAGEGVTEGSPILTPEGVLGVVWEVRQNIAQAIDWTHPQFVVSAMTANGSAYGLVEARRGRFREEDLLVLTGAPFHSDIQPGTRVVTSGRGAVFPRGVMIGTVLGIEDADTGWRKSYLIRPAVRPEGSRQVLVGIAPAGDLSDVWHVAAPPDPELQDTSAAAQPGGN